MSPILESRVSIDSTACTNELLFWPEPAVTELLVVLEGFVFGCSGWLKKVVSPAVVAGPSDELTKDEICIAHIVERRREKANKESTRKAIKQNQKESVDTETIIYVCRCSHWFMLLSKKKIPHTVGVGCYGSRATLWLSWSKERVNVETAITCVEPSLSRVSKWSQKSRNESPVPAVGINAEYPEVVVEVRQLRFCGSRFKAYFADILEGLLEGTNRACLNDKSAGRGKEGVGLQLRGGQAGRAGLGL